MKLYSIKPLQALFLQMNLLLVIDIFHRRPQPPSTDILTNLRKQSRQRPVSEASAGRKREVILAAYVLSRCLKFW